MESDTREPRSAETVEGRAMDGDKSPAGSVKRARQRMAAGLPPQQPEMPPYPMPLSIKSPKQSPPHSSSANDRNRYPPQGTRQISSPQKSAPSGSNHSERNVANFNRPQDYPRMRNMGPRQDQGIGRGPPPQRPPRPNYVPPMLQQPSNQQAQPLQYRRPPIPEEPSRNYWEDNFMDSSSSSRPVTTSTTSRGSSMGSIPDFPSIPAMPAMPSFQPPPRRNLGPPPSARKGGSSYYSQTSYVPPIPEEMSDAHSSYASSHLIPESWGDGPPQYYMGTGLDEVDEDETTGGNSGRGSSAGDHDEVSGLVRKGSRGNPKVLDTVESGDESDRGANTQRELDWQNKQDERWQLDGSGTDPIGRHNFTNNGRLPAYSGYESDATFLDSPRSQSPLPKSLNTKSSNPYFGSPGSPSVSPVDPRVGQILGHLEKGGALASSGTASPSTAPSMTEKPLKRPPPLNLEAAKEGVGRSSNSSLPELIRRATKLASNLDRGKTASRAGMLDYMNAKDKESKEKAGQEGHPGSISDILAAFPSPSPTTPTAPRPSNWPSPSPYAKSNLSRSHTVTRESASQRHRERRCCGLPVWAFLLLLIILLLLIAAAVIIPVTLVVLPRQHKSNSPDLSTCQDNNPCAHGGASVVVDSQCRCICANGYTMSSCSTLDNDCTSNDITGTDGTNDYKNATLGTSVGRILTAAPTNFSIPIASYKVLSMFSVANLSCASENALITFNQASQRRKRDFDSHFDTPSLLPKNHLHQDPTPHSLKEDLAIPPTKTHKHVTGVLHGRSSVQTSNDIVEAAPPSSGGSAPAAPTATASSSSNSKEITQQILDFARTAILFVLQETSSLPTAMTSQEKLQALLSNGKTFDATQTSAGGNITIDLSALTVGFGNGTLYGGKGAS